MMASLYLFLVMLNRNGNESKVSTLALSAKSSNEFNFISLSVPTTYWCVQTTQTALINCQISFIGSDHFPKMFEKKAEATTKLIIYESPMKFI